MNILINFIFLLIVNNVYSLLNFQRGQYNHGFLGNPSKHILLDTELPKEQWFLQYFDHFNPTNINMWKQRYFVNDAYYKPGGPIFLMIGGEDEALFPKWSVQGAWINYAKKFNALCILLEHRVYGKSQPFSDLSVKGLASLSSEAALCDIAYFIVSMNENLNLTENVKWITFGGSYPGALAAWVREKYPNLVHGAISSSSPLFTQINFNEYYEVVKDSLASYSSKCVDDIAEGISQIERLLNDKIEHSNLNDIFNLCTPIEESIGNSLDITNLFSIIAGYFAGVVQSNKINSPHAIVTIDNVCDIMLNTSIGTPVKRLGAISTLLSKTVGSRTECLDYKYDNMINMFKNTSLNSEMANGGRQWMYKTCTEFGFYQTSSKPNDLFGRRLTVDFFVKQCEDIFSKRFDFNGLNKAVKRTNIYYGGLHPHTTNVLYIHGSIDPWHIVGLTSSNNTKTPTIYIEGTAHCANMYEPINDDPLQLVEARNKIEQYLEKLLNN